MAGADWDGKWTPAADRKLLLHVLANFKEAVDFQAIATTMGCTVSSAENRVKRLKVEAKQLGFDTAMAATLLAGKRDATSPPADQTPTKKGKGKTKPVKEDEEDEGDW